MRTVKKTALVTFTARQMFELVDDVDRYDEFLPWCTRSEVLNRTEETVDATLELQHGKINKTFTTRNSRTPFSVLKLELLNGPFSSLDGGWQFDELGEAGCKVTLDLRFEFESRVVDMMFGAFFESACDSLVDAFTRRAEETYGR